MVSFNYQLPEINNTQDNSSYFGPENEYLLRQLNSLLTQKQNLHGRRIGKAKDAISPGDYVTKRQLNGTLVGTLAQRPNPLNVVVGTTYFATDRNVTYIARSGHWYYYDGIQDVTLSPDTKPSPSVLYDNGYMIYATDFDWYYRWNLITWQRLGGVNLYIQGFHIAPTKTGWGLCDGTTYNVSTDIGGIVAVNPGNLIGLAKFIKFGSTYNQSIAAVAPTISGGSLSGSASIGGTLTMPSHFHGLSTLSGAFTSGDESDTHQHSVFGGSPTLSIVDSSLQNNNYNQTGLGTAVFDINIAITGNVGNEDTAHQHDTTVDFTTNDTDSASGTSIDITHLTVNTSGLSIGAITAGTDGTPLAVQLIPYIRL